MLCRGLHKHKHKGTSRENGKNYRDFHILNKTDNLHVYNVHFYFTAFLDNLLDFIKTLRNFL